MILPQESYNLCQEKHRKTQRIDFEADVKDRSEACNQIMASVHDVREFRLVEIALDTTSDSGRADVD